MPELTVAAKKSEFEPIPHNTLVVGRLAGVDPGNWIKNEGEMDEEEILFYDWSFVISEPAKYEGREVRGRTSRNFTNHPNCKAFNWAQALTGKEFAEGEAVDTDDWIGASATLQINEKPGKDGRVWNKVGQVLPSMQSGQPVEDAF